MRAATVRAARAGALPMKFLGERLRRLEDHRFLSGRGRSVADLALPGMLDMVLVRSPHAHTRIRTVDVEVARRGEDVVVDAATGAFAVLGYIMSQDSGRLINLFIAEGQLQGGRRAGCRQRAVGGDRGAGPATLMRYAIPAPPIEMAHLETVADEAALLQGSRRIGPPADGGGGRCRRGRPPTRSRSASRPHAAHGAAPP